MLNSELEKAAWDWYDKHYGLPVALIGNREFQDVTRREIQHYINSAFTAGAKWALEYVAKETKKDMLEVYGPQVINRRGGAWAIMLGDLEKILRVKDETETKEK